MRKSLSNLFLFTTICVVLVSCANRGNPSGGLKDVTPPKITKSIPDNYTTNFTGTQIKIYFDEYIKIQNLQKQLIISPPMETTPEVTPLGTASKYITIKIFDTLQPNTTYAFNFGNSIVDNNEENPFPYYKYVFSTGAYIDSLQVKGTVVDALKTKPDEYISVRLYEVDSTFNDSIVYNKLPKYVTNTLDTTATFSIENIKAGKYMMIALKDENQDNKFQQKSDKIGFHKSYINVPTDTLYTIKIFKEEDDFQIIRPRLMSGEKIAFGFQGDYKNTQIKILSNVPDDFKYRVTKDAEKDSLYYWYTPRLADVDTLQFNVLHGNYNEDFTVKIGEQKRDSLELNSTPRGTILFTENLKIRANVPFETIDERKITILDKDSTAVNFTSELDSIANVLNIKFDKKEDESYAIQVLPDAFVDFFGDKNDTLNYKLNTKTFSDYGDVRVTLRNAIYPVIIQLTDDKGDVKVESYSTKSEPIDFRHLPPAKYYLRVIFDSNKNGKYDPGNYLKKTQAERVSFFPEVIDARAGWDWPTEFILD